ncbi:MAG: MarR family transcriptional regulator [Pigmentiphaga sp.]|nr:MarR family transcriptional regulator [Pigmentiphaga sp.]
MATHTPPRRAPRRHRQESFDPHIEGVSYGQLDHLIGYAVRRAQIRLYEDFAETLQPWNITPQRFSAFTLIHNNPGIKPTELARAMGIARSGVVIILDWLEAAGYVRRIGEQSDKRTLALEVSVAGARALAQISAAVAAHDSRMSTRLDASEKQQLMMLLDRLGY